ncbi:MAG TPA: 2,3-diphosphoglycerate-dependent phosphoglycerate mutase [Caulobacteraceae bacterium]|jgi:2,3-bisphosphoglycerate-dependent phosphoglycerate mutase|nr:2,3-diphosphoglycerate-dependent phosphoglycerate mutase [Caulobacteraceae bacterium]
MPTLMLLRHGQSQWNLENRFTGWVDVDLSPRGEAEARRAGELIAAEKASFDHAFASVLLRAIRTAWLALAAADQAWIPMTNDWRLNERHYGALTGLDKAETAARHGEEQVRLWRRSYDIAPPPLPPGGPFDLAGDRRYAGVSVPASESLETTLLRVLPCWEAVIAPTLARGANVLIAAHGNSLRAIAKHLFAMDEAAVVKLEIPTGNPLAIELSDDLRPRTARYLDATRAEALP